MILSLFDQSENSLAGAICMNGLDNSFLSHDEARLKLVNISHQNWLSLAPTMFGYGYRQSWAYGIAMANRIGGSSEHVGIYRGSQCIAVCDVRIREIPLLGGGIAYLSGGPLVIPGSWETVMPLLQGVLETLIREYVERRGLVLRIDPPIEWTAAAWDVAPMFDRLNFTKADSLKQYRTILINLSPSVEQLRNNLGRRWRECLKVAEKSSVTVQISDGVSSLDRIGPLHGQLMKRKGFQVDLVVKDYCNIQAQLDPVEKLVVKLVEIDGNVVAGHVGSVLGETSVALLVATNQRGNDQRLSYLMHWKSVIEAKERGCAWYDLGGIDPERNVGVYQFKKRMGGMEIAAHGPFELRPQGIRARVTDIAEKMYRRLRAVHQGRLIRRIPQSNDGASAERPSRSEQLVNPELISTTTLTSNK